MIISKEINIKFLGALISSKLLNFIFKLISPPLSRTTSNPLEKPRYIHGKVYVEQLPIYLVTLEHQKPFIKKADLILKLNKELNIEINGFKNWLKTTFNIDKFSKKLESYYKLSFDECLKELQKKKVDIKPRKAQELLKTEFDESLNKINPLLQKIEETDNEIDQMVYELYGLTDEEIEIIENSLKE